MTREEALRALEEYRVSIDVVEQIGRVKRAAKLPIYEPRREEQVFENITTHNGGPLTPDAVKRIFERIIDEMRTIQRIRMESSIDSSQDGDS